MFELGDGAEDVEEHSPDGGGSVYSLVEHHQVDAAVAEGLGQLDQVLERAAESVELGDDELVAGAVSGQQCFVELGP